VYQPGHAHPRAESVFLRVMSVTIAKRGMTTLARMAPLCRPPGRVVATPHDASLGLRSVDDQDYASSPPTPCEGRPTGPAVDLAVSPGRRREPAARRTACTRFAPSVVAPCRRPSWALDLLKCRYLHYHCGMKRKGDALMPFEAMLLCAGLELRARGSAEFFGYQVAKHLEDTDGAYRASGYGTLYRTLDRLEEAGMLESHRESPEIAEAERRPRRRLYRVTPIGERALGSAARVPVASRFAPRLVLP